MTTCPVCGARTASDLERRSMRRAVGVTSEQTAEIDRSSEAEHVCAVHYAERLAALATETPTEGSN